MKSQILTFWNFYRTQVRSLPWKSFYYLIPILNFALNVGFVKVLTWTSTGHMDLPKLIYGFAKVVTWVLSKFVLCFSCPLPNKTSLKFDHDLKACWSFCFEMKLLNESKYLGLGALVNVLKVWRRINSSLLVADLKFVTTVMTSGRVKNVPAV